MTGTLNKKIARVVTNFHLSKKYKWKTGDYAWSAHGKKFPSAVVFAGVIATETNKPHIKAEYVDLEKNQYVTTFYKEINWEYSGFRGNKTKSYPKGGIDYSITPVLRQAISVCQPAMFRERCAEQHNACRLIDKCNCNIDDIRFSKAVRPRTGIQQDYCGICSCVFKNCELNGRKEF